MFAVERGAIEVNGNALVVSDLNGIRAQLPVGAMTVLMLQPGSTITHAAVKLCAENRTFLIWTGEGGVRLYSAGQEGSAHAYKLLRQARLALNPATRLHVAREMYRRRFLDEPPKKRSIEQLRGMEGARVRAIYRQLAAAYDVEWTGRNYDRSDWVRQDALNRALSAANSCLYGVCHAAILVAGYSAALGFVHTGYPLAFVHDVADLYKMELAAPIAFATVAEGAHDVETRVRHRLRDGFRRIRFLERMIPGLETLLEAGEKRYGRPDELGGCTLEIATPADAPWQRRALPEADKVAAELMAATDASPEDNDTDVASGESDDGDYLPF